MKTVVVLLLTLCCTAFAASPGKLTAETSQRKIYEIIDSHENRKYGDHGGHEYENDELARKQASHKRYGYLPLNAEIKAPVYYETPPKYNLASDNNIYRENVAAYAPKPTPLHLQNAPHQVIASPQSHSHYAIIDPITKNHQYVTLVEPKPQYQRHLTLPPKSSYILEEEPHYAVPEIASKSTIPHVPQHHHPVQDYSLLRDHQLLDKSHFTSGHDHYGDNSIHGESGHKAHKKHEISGHKSHSSSGGHHDNHDHHHNRGHYERDRGYHYEKAYAYDRVRAHHDIGSGKGAHSNYKTQHSQEGHKDSGSQNAHTYFKKQGEHGYQDKSDLYKGGHHSGHGYNDYNIKYLSPHHHAYGK